MKTVILAGGFGTRLSEETKTIPKPMVQIGGKPILWHIMKLYSHYGFNDFIICLGYKGHLIKEYFKDHHLYDSNITIDVKKNKIDVHDNECEPWKITLIDTGLNTMTGGRIKRIADYLDDGPFMFTYGDGVGDINIKKLVEFHKKHGKLATVTAIQPEGRFGALNLEGSKVKCFAEKLDTQNIWVNGGFFVLDKKIIDYIEGDHTLWERDPMEKLAKEGNLHAYFHKKFWKPMDTLRDKHALEELWNSGKAPWKIWKG